MDRGYTPLQFEGLFATAAGSDADQRLHQLSARNLAPRCANNAQEGNAVRAYIRGKAQPNLFHSVYDIAQRWI